MVKEMLGARVLVIIRVRVKLGLGFCICLALWVELTPQNLNTLS